MNPIPYPPRLDLARTPTPFEPLTRFGRRLGISLYVKRDDLTGGGLSGNKIRKLEFALAQAQEQKADTVVTCGGAQSNHARATAVAAARLGIGCRLLLRTEDPDRPPAPEGNVLLDRMAGADIVWVTPEQYREQAAMLDRHARQLADSGRRPYIIPEGASNAVGAWGYIRAAEELAADLKARFPDSPSQTTIVMATGSGGTAAGMMLGNRLTGLNARLVTVNVCDDGPHFRAVIDRIAAETIATYRLPQAADPLPGIDILDGYVGRGYALSRPQERSLLIDLARLEGLFLDPVYTGKAFFGMVSELEKNPSALGERVVFLHTGGLYGLLAQWAAFAPDL
jgi:D-cysteine desulfhydrase